MKDISYPSGCFITVKELCSMYGVPDLLLAGYEINADFEIEQQTEDAEYEIIQPKQIDNGTIRTANA